MAAIIDFNGSGRLGREINLYQGGGGWSKIRGGRGGGGGINTAFHSPAPCPHHPLRLQIKHGQSDKQSRAYRLSAHPNKTPAPQVSWYLMIFIPDDPIVGCDDFGDDDLGDAEAIQALTNIETNRDEKPTTKVKVVQTLQ